MRWTEDDLKRIQAKRVKGGGSQTAFRGKVPQGLTPAGKSPCNARGLQTEGVRKLSERGGLVTAPSPTKLYKSKLEAAFSLYLQNQQRHELIDGWLYEPFTFKLSSSGKRYRVDFIAWGFNRDYDVHIPFVVAYEVKGWHKNYRDSLTHLAWAAQKFPFFQFKKVVSNGKRGFEILDVRV